MADPEVSSAVSKQVQEIQKRGGQLGDDALDQLARSITSAFQVKKDELAIFRLSVDGKSLNFLYPVRLQKIGAIPMTLTHSLAAKTIREKRGEIVNNFASYKHPTVFEAVSLSEEEKATPIQKIMSVPLVADRKVMGVIQVSRRAKLGEAAGPDFTSGHLAELSKIGGILGKFLAVLPPPSPLPVKPKP